MISTREFLQESGVSLAGPPVAPADVHPLLITAAITCVTAPVMARILTKAGLEVSSRTVANWLQSTRVWLGLPPANRGKRSRKYRRELEEWHRINGHPTADEIDGGWTPVHRRLPQQTPQPGSEPTPHERAFDSASASVPNVNADDAGLPKERPPVPVSSTNPISGPAPSAPPIFNSEEMEERQRLLISLKKNVGI
jgi:hypothetical protein